MNARPLPTPGPGEPPGFDPRAMASYYSYPGQFDGSGTSIALVSLFGGYRRSDLETYFAGAILPMPTVEDVSVDGARNDPSGDPDDNLELTQDLEILGSVAPGARLVVYFAENNEQGLISGLSQAILDSGRDSPIVCLNWCIPESELNGMIAQEIDRLAMAAVMLGKTICAPAGAAGPGEQAFFPGTGPHVLSCGETWAAPGGDGLVECPAPGMGDAAAGSRLYPRPEWQAGVSGRSGREAGGRLVPDVTCFAGGELGYRCHANGTWLGVTRPAVAACMWAGLLARVHQALGRPWGTVSDFYTVLGLAGALAPPGGGPGSAHPAWDARAGWGTPHGERLLTVLQNRPRTRQGGRRAR
jgi:kumamolisin